MRARHSVNQGFSKEAYRKSNAVKRSGPFSEPPDSEYCNFSVLIPFPNLGSYVGRSRLTSVATPADPRGEKISFLCKNFGRWTFLESAGEILLRSKRGFTNYQRRFVRHFPLEPFFVKWTGPILGVFRYFRSWQCLHGAQFAKWTGVVLGILGHFRSGLGFFAGVLGRQIGDQIA